jgi:hypothetical protein
MDERSDPAAAGHRHEAEELAGKARQVVRAMEDFQDPSQEWRRRWSRRR